MPPKPRVLGHPNREHDSRLAVKRRRLRDLGRSKLLDTPPQLRHSGQEDSSSQQRIRRTLRTFEESLGGRPALIEALEGSDNPKIVQLALNMQDPKYGTYSLAKLCSLVQLSVGQLLQAFTKEDGARAFTQAIAQVNRRLPEIAADLANRALPHFEPCPECNGMGCARDPITSKWTKELCPRCEGLKKVEIAPDIERVKLAAQVGGLVKGGGAQVAVQVNQQVNVNPAPQSSPEFREAIGRLLYPGRSRTPVEEPPTDAEPADPKP